MSKFLAPIHSWLFNKVLIHEGLEREIEAGFKSQYGDDVTKIINMNIEKYGPRLESDNLEDIIDASNIHGWLQESITVAETRQAAIIASLVDKYGDKAVDLIHSVYRDNAIEHAKSAKETIVADTPEDINKVVNNYILNGMPCDNAGSVTKSDADILETVQNSCLHIGYWKTAGVDADLMYSLRSEWTKAFVAELNPLYIYDAQISKSDDGNRSFVYTIKKK